MRSVALCNNLSFIRLARAEPSLCVHFSCSDCFYEDTPSHHEMFYRASRRGAARTRFCVADQIHLCVLYARLVRHRGNE